MNKILIIGMTSGVGGVETYICNILKHIDKTKFQIDLLAIPREVEQYTPYQKQRLFVKPGLTCIWQVSGRNNIEFDQWVELDIEYIKTRSLWLDIKLILLTFQERLNNTRLIKNSVYLSNLDSHVFGK